MAEKVLGRNNIRLYGVDYPIIGPIQPQVVSQFPAKLITGDTSRSSQQNVSEWDISDLTGGMLVENMDERQHADRFWDADGVWTMDARGITLAPLVTTRGTDLGSTTKKTFFYLDKSYVLASVVKRWNTVTELWDTVLTPAGGTLTDNKVWVNNSGVKRVYVSCGSGGYYHSTSGDAGSWTNVAGTFHYLTEFDGKLISHDDTHIKYSFDGDTWTNLMPYQRPWAPTSLATIRTADTREEVIVVGFPDGIYYLDFWTARMEKVIDQGSQPYQHTGRWPLIHRDEMWVPACYQFIRVVGSVVTNVGLTREDGLPAGHDARVIMSRGVGDDIYAIAGSTLYAYNGAGWHVVHRTASGRTMESLAIEELVYASSTAIKVFFTEGQGGSTHLCKYLTLPATGLRLLQDPTQAYVATGSLTTGRFDGNFVNWWKNALGLELTCRQMSVDETINVYHEIDNAGSWTLLGTVNTDGVTIFNFLNGGLPLGQLFKKIRLKFALARGATVTNTPVMESAVFRYLRVPTTIYGWRATLDCRQPYAGKHVSDLITGLLTAIDTGTLGVLSYFPNGDRYVKVLSMVGTESTGRNRDGQYTITMSEMK